MVCELIFVTDDADIRFHISAVIRVQIYGERSWINFAGASPAVDIVRELL